MLGRLGPATRAFFANLFPGEATRALPRHRSGLRATSFAGAQATRFTRDLASATILSADQEVQWDLTTLRARARRLVRDNSHASGFVNELTNNIVGPEGILLQAKVRTADGELFEATNDEIERGWAAWGLPETCTADGHEDWTEVQRLAIKTLPTDGELFVRRLKYFDNAFGYTLQFLDADLLDENFNVPAQPGRNEIRMGVEVDRFNRPVAYHFWDRHPSEIARRKRIPVPADQVTHLFIRYRANQTRGVSWFAPILLDLKDMNGYRQAELMRARAAASQMGVILNKSQDAIAAYKPPEAGEDPKVYDVEPLTLTELAPGQELGEFNPNVPSASFKDFEKAVLRSIARGLNMAYTTLTGDLEAVNYSSIRAGLLSERDHYRGLQRWFAMHFHRVVYREWISMAILTGAVAPDTRLASDFLAVEWQPRGWKWVDPKSDLEAIQLAIGMGLTTHQKQAAESGSDFEENVDQLRHEKEYAADAGVDVSGGVPKASAPAPAPDGSGQPASSQPEARRLVAV